MNSRLSHSCRREISFPNLEHIISQKSGCQTHYNYLLPSAWANKYETQSGIEIFS